MPSRRQRDGLGAAGTAWRGPAPAAGRGGPGGAPARRAPTSGWPGASIHCDDWLNGMRQPIRLTWAQARIRGTDGSSSDGSSSTVMAGRPRRRGGGRGDGARPGRHGGRSAGAAYVPARMTLRLGMSGPAVRALQRRLSVLHYYPGRIDGHFGWATMEAVWAFKEVQTGKVIPPNPDIVGPAMQRQLLHPRLPKVLRPHGPGWRVEINKNIQVLVVYRRGKVILISHTATAKYYRSDGSGWITPDGKHRALRFVRGWVCGGLGCMYNPVVF